MARAILPAMHQVRLIVSGRVQGVGFRWFVRRRADELGLCGRVRNRMDGCVEVEAEGARAALEAFVAEVGRGPTAARIEHVDESWSEGPSRHRSFEIDA